VLSRLEEIGAARDEQVSYVHGVLKAVGHWSIVISVAAQKNHSNTPGPKVFRGKSVEELAQYKLGVGDKIC
jgi:hypothetical protein